MKGCNFILNTKKTIKRKKILKEIKEWILHLFVAFVVVLFLSSEVFALTEVRGRSMENTFIEGEKLYIDKISYKFSPPKTDDIIVFLQGEINEGIKDRLTNVLEDIKMKLQKNPRRNRYIKRVIAIPGDKVEIENGRVYVNDELLEELYIKGTTSGKVLEYPLTVPNGKIFVMGDNRENSSDSREFGFVDYGSIEGKVKFKIWPIGK